jgi:DNA primase
VIDWVMRMHKVSFRHACELLAKQHPALAAAVSTDTPTATVKLSAGKLRTAQSFSLAAGDQELLDQVIDFYHTTLKASPEALEYLENGGLGESRADRALPPGLCESHAGLSAGAEAVQSGRGDANRVAAGRHLARLGA